MSFRLPFSRGARLVRILLHRLQLFHDVRIRFWLSGTSPGTALVRLGYVRIRRSRL
jgi:hypothetical protein